MTYHTEHDFPIEQLNPLARRGTSTRRDIPFGGALALIAAVAMGLWKPKPTVGEKLAA